MTKVIARVHPVHLMNADWPPGGRQSSDQSVDLGCENAENWQLSSTSTIAIVIITQPIRWYSFYRPTKGGRLSRPKHCSRRDKHNCRRRDSNLGPLTPQSLGYQPLIVVCRYLSSSTCSAKTRRLSYDRRRFCALRTDNVVVVWRHLQFLLWMMALRDGDVRVAWAQLAMTSLMLMSATTAAFVGEIYVFVYLL